jgi:hypothetical protein
MSTKKDMMNTSSNNSEHYIKNGVYYDIKKEEERFASLLTPVRAFIRRMVLERRNELLLEIVKLSGEITSLSKTNQPDISKVWYCNPSWCGPIPYLSTQTKLCDPKELGTTK